MEPRKPLILKTYGKQKRQLSAWITLENRKQAFDSTASTDGDTSAHEPTKPPTKRAKRTNVAVTARKVAQPAKKKAMLCLTENSDEENVNSEENVASTVKRLNSPPHRQASHQRKTTRGKKTSVSNGIMVRPAKRKAVLQVTGNSSNEENIGWPSPPLPQPTHPSKTARSVCRKRRLVSAAGVLIRQKGQQVPETSESEEQSMAATKCHRKSVLKKRDSEVQHRSVGRFVTRRRRGAAVVPKLPKSIVSTLNSSDDFSSSRNLRPIKRRKIPPTFLSSSAENSINGAGTFSFVTNPLRELSINESADRSLGPHPRNPIFCSTPSASSFSKHQHIKPFPINVKSSTPPSMTVSPFQGAINSSEHLVSPLHPAPPSKLEPSLGNQEAHLHRYEEQSVDLFMEYKSTNKRNRSSDEAKSHSEDSRTNYGGRLPSLLLLSTDSEKSSDFASATGGLEWLIEALKEKCLTERCTVQLQRLDSLSLTQLCSQTLYSSCLELLSSDHPLSPDGSRTASTDHHLSVTNSKTRDYLQFGNSLGSPGQVATDDSTHHIESSVEFIGEAKLVRSLQTLFTEEETLALKEECLSRKCTAQLIKLSWSKLKGFAKQKEAHSVCCRRSVIPDANNTGNDEARNSDGTEELACSGENAEGMRVSVRQPGNTSSPVAHTQSSDPTHKCNVELVRIRLSKEDKNHKSPTAGYEQMNNGNHSESDSTLNGQKQSSGSSEDRISPDEDVIKRPGNNLPKRKKMSLVPSGKHGRSTFADRPGTSRKACVSGLSVSRWKNKGSSCKGTRPGNIKTVDCSINELIATKHRAPRELDTTRNFSTPVRAAPLNLSTLLADFTPNTHTWSRLKAALSVHRKVLLSPRSPATRRLDVSQDLFATPLRTLLPKHLLSQLHHSSSVVCEDAELSDAEKVYAECGQKQPLPWEECILPHRMKRCVKIGEGTFGEVFSTTNASGDTVALKVIPLEGSEKVNGEDQKTFAEILHEIIISKELSSLKEKQQNQTHSFIGLNDLHCVRGSYPPDFLNAWDKFDQQKGSENDRPDFFEKDQLFLILEFEFGGIDLENSNGTLASLGVAKSILHQVTAALAVAEQELHFEHRDLHWGNVLVKTTKQKAGSFLLNGAAHSVETKGVLVRIIDYSLSRLEIDDLTVSCDISKDEELFMGQGDYQFEIYRLMRQENGNNWSDFHPHTNVLWLHYLCSKLLSMKYRNSRVRGVKDMRNKLTSFYDNVLQYSSAIEVLQNCPMFQ